MRTWHKRAAIDAGQVPGTSTADAQRIRELEGQVRELKRANKILLAASSFFVRELCATRRRDDRGGVRGPSCRAVAAAW